MSYQSVLEFLTIRNKTQVNATVVNDGSASNVGPFTDERIAVYYMWSTCDCYITHSSTVPADSLIATSETGTFLNAYNVICIEIVQDDYLSVIAVSGQGGTLRFVPLSKI